MLSRIVCRSVANIIYRNCRPFHESVRCMKEDDAIKPYERRDISMKNRNYSTTVIESARNSIDFLNSISKNVEHFWAKETMELLRTLFELQKDANTSVHQKDILQNSDFKKLCRSLERNAPQMELNDVIDALNIISSLGQKTSSSVTERLLKRIEYQINDKTWCHTIFLDDNFAKLIEVLEVVSDYSITINDPNVITNIGSALIFRGEDLSPEQGSSIVWSLIRRTLGIQKDDLDKILEHAIRAMSRRDITDRKDVWNCMMTLEEMVAKYLSDPHKFEKFYDETFFNKCADSIVANDLGFGDSALIQRHFNKLGFVHVEMLNYMLQEVEKDPQLITDGEPTNLLALMTALSLANFKPLNLSPEQGSCLVRSLSHRTLRIQKDDLDKILEHAIEAMSRRDITDRKDVSNFMMTLEEMVAKYLSDPHKFEKFYDETFFNKCADSIVANDLGFGESALIQRHFNDLHFVHVEMLNYMLQEVERDPQLIIDGEPTTLITFVGALSNANYKPQNWDQIKALILRSTLLTKVKRLNLPWAKISLELLAIGIECPAIWDKVFNKQYIEYLVGDRDYRKRKLWILELYQIIGMTGYNVEGKLDEKFLVGAKKLLHSSVQYPMQQYVELAFGGPSFVFTTVRTKFGQIINHVIAFDKKTLEPAQTNEGFHNDVFYEDIVSDKSKLHIAVISFPSTCFCINVPIMRATFELSIRTYEKMGINAVWINEEMWDELPYVEKIPYIQRLVRLKAEQVQSALR